MTQGDNEESGFLWGKERAGEGGGSVEGVRVLYQEIVNARVELFVGGLTLSFLTGGHFEQTLLTACLCRLHTKITENEWQGKQL